MADQIFITAGFIEYSEQVQPGTFGSPQAKAHFAFAIPDGEGYEATAQLAAREAKNYVRTILGLKKAEPAAAAPQPVILPATPTADTGSAPLNDKEKLAAELVARTTPKATTKKRAPAAAVEAPTGQAISQGTAGDDPKPGSEETGDPTDDGNLDELFGDESKPAEPVKPVKIITDKELVEAVQKRNGIIKKPKEITALKEKYSGPMPKQLRDIPADKREDFLKELEALS